jgi:hypothetical protein
MKNQYIVKTALMVLVALVAQSCFVAKEYEKPTVSR